MISANFVWGNVLLDGKLQCKKFKFWKYYMKSGSMPLISSDRMWVKSSPYQISCWNKFWNVAAILKSVSFFRFYHWTKIAILQLANFFKASFTGSMFKPERNKINTKWYKDIADLK